MVRSRRRQHECVEQKVWRWVGKVSIHRTSLTQAESTGIGQVPLMSSAEMPWMVRQEKSREKGPLKVISCRGAGRADHGLPKEQVCKDPRQGRRSEPSPPAASRIPSQVLIADFLSRWALTQPRREVGRSWKAQILWKSFFLPLEALPAPNLRMSPCLPPWNPSHSLPAMSP